MKTFYGKYRAKVTGNSDSLSIGRVEVLVPSVLGESRVWALPSVPYAGPQVGWFAVPPVGANVWVEFEAGDPDRAIWTGCFWNRGELPDPSCGPDVTVLRTKSITLKFDEGSNGGLSLEAGAPLVSNPVKLTLDGNGIALTHGSYSIKIGPSGVSVNDGALEVS